jgi:hypothetical protein
MNGENVLTAWIVHYWQLLVALIVVVSLAAAPLAQEWRRQRRERSNVKARRRRRPAGRTAVAGDLAMPQPKVARERPGVDKLMIVLLAMTA